ncbi:hypothetical protein [Brachyspira intermedia]|nr:hypothetical protein [Brachyspira intermedia]
MRKKIILLLISLFLLSLIFISCSSPYGSSSGVKFKSRKGIYQNETGKIAVTINEQENNNLRVIDLGSSAIDETLTVNSESAANYMTVKSVKYEGYVYTMNFGNSVNTIFFTISDNKNNNVVFNEKLSKQ